MNFFCVRMLGLLLAVAAPYDLNCTAPLTHADPPAGASLEALALFIRDGQRTPQSLWLPKNASGYWVCDSDTAEVPRIHVANLSGALRRYATPFDPALVDYPPNCGLTDLTLQGMRSHAQLGAFYREFLIGRLLPDALDPAILEFHASYPESTFRSAEAFVNTLYPPARPFEFLEITTGSTYADPLYIDYGGICPEIRSAWANFTASDLFRQRRQQAGQVYAPLFAKLNMTITDTNWLLVGDWLSSAYCGGQGIPEEVTDAVFAQAIKDWALYSWGPLGSARGVGASAILRQLFEAFNATLAGRSQKKFFLYSGHEKTVVALLSTLGVNNQDLLLPYRSHLAVEVWNIGGVHNVRFVLNGVPVPIDLLGERTLVTYQDLQAALGPYLGYCTAFD